MAPAGGDNRDDPLSGAWIEEDSAGSGDIATDLYEPGLDFPSLGHAPVQSPTEAPTAGDNALAPDNHTIVDMERPEFLMADTQGDLPIGDLTSSPLSTTAAAVEAPQEVLTPPVMRKLRRESRVGTGAPGIAPADGAPPARRIPRSERNLRLKSAPPEGISGGAIPRIRSEVRTHLHQEIVGEPPSAVLEERTVASAPSLASPRSGLADAKLDRPADLGGKTVLDFRAPLAAPPVSDPLDGPTRLDRSPIKASAALGAELGLESTAEDIEPELETAPPTRPSRDGPVPEGPTPNVGAPLSAEHLEEMSNVEQFGQYRLLGRVGVGGMAEVRLACRTAKGGKLEPCVIKRIAVDLSYEEDVREMFLEEARICGQLHHPNIVRMIEYDEIDDVPYIAMELIDGANLSSLDALAGDAGIPLEVSIEIGRQVASALGYAHRLRGPDGQSLNIIHRDVSPQNVLVSRDGDVKLADFGIARFEGRMHKTAIGPPKGKLPYLSPEQLRYMPMDQRVDIFALGLTLLEVLTGRVVLREGALVIDDLEAHVRQRCAEAPRRLPSDLIELLVEMTAFELEDRLSTIDAVESRLARLGTAKGQNALVAFASNHIAAKLPSAEATIHAILGDEEEVTTNDRRPEEALDLSQTIDALDAGAFPTMAHLMIAADELARSGPSPSVLGDVGAPLGLADRARAAQRQIRDTEDKRPRVATDGFVRDSVELVRPLFDTDESAPSGRFESGFAPTFIRTPSANDGFSDTSPSNPAPPPAPAPIVPPATHAIGSQMEDTTRQVAAPRQDRKTKLLIGLLMVGALILGVLAAVVLRGALS